MQGWRREEGEVGFDGDGVGEEGWSRGIVEERGERWGEEEGGDGDERVVIEEKRRRREEEGRVGSGVREILLSPGVPSFP